MKTNELMIGDWVKCGRHYIKVTQLEDEIVYGDSETGSHWCCIEKVEPILITPEILEKNGFVANKHVYPYPYYEYIDGIARLKVGFAFPQGNRTLCKEPWVYIDSEYVLAEHIPCVFVHQLQQAMYICKINKEIII